MKQAEFSMKRTHWNKNNSLPIIISNTEEEELNKSIVKMGREENLP